MDDIDLDHLDGGLERIMHEAQSADDVLLLLTKREQDVAKRLAAGFTSRAIANVLKVSIKTIDTHRGHVMKKLGLANNVELTHLAIARGWVEIKDFSELEKLALKQAAK